MGSENGYCPEGRKYPESRPKPHALSTYAPKHNADVLKRQKRGIEHRRTNIQGQLINTINTVNHFLLLLSTGKKHL
ncbi:MAG TPA: hypothetical protein DHW79_10370 [Candidatus Cloacimonas sp.]|nr:hypothetical protein [Candidatus Cloacimonas sp.]